MKIDQLVTVTITNFNKSYYESLGFKDLKCNKAIIVNVSQLSNNSMVRETRKCDNCGKEYAAPHQSLEKSFASFGEDICPSCVKLEAYQKKIVVHRRETNLKKYGTETPAQNEAVKNKMIETNLVKYGTKSTASVQEVRDKMKETLTHRYGVENPMKNREILQKVQNTCIEKYGGIVPTKSKEVLEKIRNTNLEKYGVASTAQAPEVREKMTASMYSHGKVPTSSKQYEVYQLIKNRFTECIVELNFPVSNLNLDIMLEKDGAKFDIEYDGKYWHESRAEKDMKRDLFLESKGYKIIRIKSGRLIPDIEILSEIIEDMIKTNSTFENIYLSDWSSDA